MRISAPVAMLTTLAAASPWSASAVAHRQEECRTTIVAVTAVTVDRPAAPSHH